LQLSKNRAKWGGIYVIANYRTLDERLSPIQKNQISPMKKAVKNQTEHKPVRAIILSLSLLVLATLPCPAQGAERPAAADVWERAQSLGARHNLDPLLIFAIACAESSLDPAADSGVARGIMQMTEDAWGDVSPLSYRKAWDWRENMDAATAYLAWLRDNLVKNGHYTPANLVAAYHFGPGRLDKAGFDVGRLPSVKNLIYREILAGRAPILPDPAPSRILERIWRRQTPLPESPETKGPLTLPVLPVPDSIRADDARFEIVMPSLISGSDPLDSQRLGTELKPLQPREPLELPQLVPPAPADDGSLDFGMLLHWDETQGAGAMLLPELDRSIGSGTEEDPLSAIPVLRTFPEESQDRESLDAQIPDEINQLQPPADFETPDGTRREPERDGDDGAGPLPPLNF